MSEIYKERLHKIAEEVHISPGDLQAYLYGDLPFKKQLVFERDNIHQAIENAIWNSGDGIFYCLIYKTDARKTERQPASLFSLTDYVRQIYRSIYQEAIKHGYTASYRYNDYRLADETYYENVLQNQSPAGLIYFIPDQMEAVRAATQKLQVPLLILDHRGEGDDQNFYTLGIDSRRVMKELVELLIDIGHTRIAHLTGNMSNPSALERLEGYQMAMREAGLPIHPDWIKHGNWQNIKGEQLAMELLLLQGDERPTAICCANDVSALGAYAAVFKAGLTVPGDISITGFDNLPVSESTNPPMTTVHQPIVEIGERAAELMVEILEGNHPEKRQIFDQLPIIQRGSIAPPSA